MFHRHSLFLITTAIFSLLAAVPAAAQTQFPPAPAGQLIFVHSLFATGTPPVAPHEYSLSYSYPTIPSNHVGIVGYETLTNGFLDVPRTDVMTIVKDGEFAEDLYVYNDSTVTLDGGKISKSLTLSDDATANLIDGSVALSIYAVEQPRDHWSQRDRQQHAGPGRVTYL